MFTGIIEETGHVQSVDSLTDAVRIRIAGRVVLEGTGPGDSIAVNGVCLTVVDPDAQSFAADVMRETLVRSTLGSLVVGDPVNLERAARLDSRLGGHLVQGHVDGTAAVLEVQPQEQWTIVRFELPSNLSRYVVEKGSITVDGVSLTVVSVDADSFTVSLIPTTLAETTLGMRQAGDTVNLEVDAIAKYVERLMKGQS